MRVRWPPAASPSPECSGAPRSMPCRAGAPSFAARAGSTRSAATTVFGWWPRSGVEAEPVVTRSFLVLALAAATTQGRALESLWYLRGEESIQAFLAHAYQISIVSPQVFVMDSNGIITGSVDPRVVTTARAKGVKLIPLVMNPGFDQPSIHRVLNDSAARATALRSLAELCRVNRFDGILFDFENFHVSDRDAFTAFTRMAVASVHRAGCSLSAAVVPRMTDDPGLGQLRSLDPRQLAGRVRLQGAGRYPGLHLLHDLRPAHRGLFARAGGRVSLDAGLPGIPAGAGRPAGKDLPRPGRLLRLVVPVVR